MKALKTLRDKLFPPHFSFLHWLGKDFVSPKAKMKAVIAECLGAGGGAMEHNIMDFGSGTLVWAEYFAKAYRATVYAVDTYYTVYTPPAKERIRYYTDFKHCCADIARFSCVWACDVLHHITKDVCDDFFNTIAAKTDLIIIKDNDSNHPLRFLFNRLSDKILNGESIYNVYPQDIQAYLEARGFRVTYRYMPKFFYPHFMLTAVRAKESTPATTQPNTRSATP